MAAARASRGELFPLLVGARAGDRDALDHLLRRIRPRVHAQVAYRFRGRWPEMWAEDVVQETLLDVLRGVSSCRAGCEVELRAWLRTILRRQVGLLVRHEAPWAESTDSLTSLPELPASPSYPLSPILESRLEALHAATDRLAADQACLLWLRIQTHASWREVGNELEIPPTAAKRRFQRLVATLRRSCVLDPP